MADKEITSVVVATYDKRSFAQMAKELLENEGIMAEISGQGDTGLKYYIGDATTDANYEVIVHPDFADRASEIIASTKHYHAEEPPSSEEIDEENEGLWKELIKIDSSMVAEALEDALEDKGIPARIEEIDLKNKDSHYFHVTVPDVRLEDAKIVLDRLEKGLDDEK
ncbi:MAG: hypothetical protein ACLFSQ_08565 [Candidatus Zixiibacteriota bacterium]